MKYIFLCVYIHAHIELGSQAIFRDHGVDWSPVLVHQNCGTSLLWYKTLEQSNHGDISPGTLRILIFEIILQE